MICPKRALYNGITIRSTVSLFLSINRWKMTGRKCGAGELFLFGGRDSAVSQQNEQGALGIDSPGFVLRLHQLSPNQYRLPEVPIFPLQSKTNDVCHGIYGRVQCVLAAFKSCLPS